MMAKSGWGGGSYHPSLGHYRNKTATEI